MENRRPPQEWTAGSQTDSARPEFKQEAGVIEMGKQPDTAGTVIFDAFNLHAAK